MKHLFCTITAALALTLTACGSKDVEVLPADTVGLRITSEVPAGVTAARITVIPNDVAPWVSQILLLADDGKLYRTSATGGKAQGVNGGDLKDMVGLMRKGDAGTALTLTREGKLTALIEKDDEGRLARMNVSSKATSYGGFCQHAKAPTDTVMAFTGKTLVTLSISYKGDEVLTASETDRQSFSKPITACFISTGKAYVLAGGQLYADGVETGNLSGQTRILTGISDVPSSTLLYTEGTNRLSTLRDGNPKARRTIVIQDGLSVMGTESLSSVFVTDDSLGGTFSEGAIIAQDSNSDRLILVSVPFAWQVLTKKTSKKR